MKKALFLLLLILSACGKNGRKQPKDISRWEGMEHNLTAESVELDTALLEFSNIIPLDDHIIFQQYRAQKQFYLYRQNGNSLSYMGSFLNIGRGPYEAMAAEAFHIPENNALVIVGENFYGSSFVIPLDDIKNLLNPSTWRNHYNEALMAQARVAPVDTTSLIVQKGEGRHIFGITGMDNSAIEDVDITYPEESKDLSDSERSSNVYFGSRIHKRPNHKQFVYSTQDGFFVKVFTLNNDGIVTEQFDLFDELPQYTVTGSGKVIKNESNKFGLIIATTDRYIYCVDRRVSNRTFRDCMQVNGYPLGYAKTIYVSDWKGKARIKYTTDLPVMRVVVDNRDEYLYGVTRSEETMEERLVRFRLPKLD